MRFALRLRRTTLVWTMLATTSIGARDHRPGAPTPQAPATRVATGRIEGTVEISSTLTARRPQFRIYTDPGSGGPPPPRDPAAHEVRNVVIYLEGDSSQLVGTPRQRDAKRRETIGQRDERFTPHVVAVTRGGTVEFPNLDDVFHNVFSLSGAAGRDGFDLGRYPKGASREWTFPKTGTVQVFCHIHSDMSAVVLVLPNPFFASPEEGRRYVIDDVPEGDYTIVGWHERIKPIPRRVRVTAGQTSVVDFNIPLPQGGGRP